MSNLISRQAVIDALRDAENHAFNSHYKGFEKAHKIIADLPSAQPDTYEALRILDAINSSGRLDYGDYCDLYDAISEIGGAQNG